MFVQLFASLPRLFEQSAEQRELGLAEVAFLNKSDALTAAKGRLKIAKQLGDPVLRRQREQEYIQAVSEARTALARYQALERTVQPVEASGVRSEPQHAGKVD